MRTRYFLFILLLAFSACKTPVAYRLPPVTLRDSISITYKQGKEQPLFITHTEEQPASLDAIGAAIESRKNSSAPADGTVGLGATREASVFEGLLSQRTNKPAVPPSPTIRVDTMFVERWHTTEVPSPPKPIPRFYKDCTWGFFILLLLTIGRIALRITKAIYQRR